VLANALTGKQNQPIPFSEIFFQYRASRPRPLSAPGLPRVRSAPLVEARRALQSAAPAPVPAHGRVPQPDRALLDPLSDAGGRGGACGAVMVYCAECTVRGCGRLLFLLLAQAAQVARGPADKMSAGLCGPRAARTRRASRRRRSRRSASGPRRPDSPTRTAGRHPLSTNTERAAGPHTHMQAVHALEAHEAERDLRAARHLCGRELERLRDLALARVLDVLEAHALAVHEDLDRLRRCPSCARLACLVWESRRRATHPARRV
jgi:hypothetical protein